MQHNPKEDEAQIVKIVTLMMETNEGDILTFEQISLATGIIDINGGHPKLRSALTTMERTHGVVFKNVRNKGYLRLDNSEGAEYIASTFRNKSRANAIRAKSKFTNCVDYSKLSKSQQYAYAAAMVQMQASEIWSSPSGTKQILSNIHALENKDYKKINESMSGLFS